MDVERIAVATAVVSAAVSALSLLLAWYRGSTQRRPRLVRTLGAVMLVSMVAVVVAIGFAETSEERSPVAAAVSLTANEYRVRLIRICEQYTSEAERLERAEGHRQAAGLALQLESATTARIRTLRPPDALAGDHRSVVALWDRRVSLLGHYYERYRHERKDAAFIREYQRAIGRVNELARRIGRRFESLDVTPECALFG
jgi:hypothetical protein